MSRKILFFMVFFLFSFFLSGCGDHKKSNTIVFATSAEYPPFEYKVQGKLVGFDIELGQLIAEKLGKKAIFQDMAFGAILPAIQSGLVDAGLSTITITKARQKNFDFSQPYHTDSMAILWPNTAPLHTISDLDNQRIACQLGTTMEIWLKTHAKHTTIITMNTNPQSVEALKSGHVSGVLMDTVQAHAFATRNPGLGYSVIAQADAGYGIAFPKGSPWVKSVNAVIQTLIDQGRITKLQKKYLGVSSWKQ